MTSEIPLYDVTKVIGTEIIGGIREVLESGWLTHGPKTKQFEEEFASEHGVSNAVAVNSCTSALYCALEALGIGEDDTVVVPATTFVATANVVELLGADVVLCDVKKNSNLDPTSLESVVKSHEPAAAIPVHLYGQACKMDEVMRIATEYALDIVEDCAHSPLATYRGQSVGSFGEAGCFSFYATKNMTTGEGGMVTTDHDEIDSKVRKLRNHHQTKTPEQKENTLGYDVDALGFNFRMSEFQAAIGISQLNQLPEMTRNRQQVAMRYVKAIENIDGIVWEGSTENRNHAFHLFVVRVTDEYPLTRDELYDSFKQRDIVTGVHYPSISMFSYYEDIDGEYALAETLTNEILSLPMHTGMETHTQDRVVQVLREHSS